MSYIYIYIYIIIYIYVSTYNHPYNTPFHLGFTTPVYPSTNGTNQPAPAISLSFDPQLLTVQSPNDSPISSGFEGSKFGRPNVFLAQVADF